MATNLDDHARDLDQPLDPAPHPVDLAHKRIEQFVDNLTSQGLDELRQFRDDTDALMVALTKRGDAITHAAAEHAANIAAVIESKKIMAEQTQKMKEMFAPVQAVMTQEGGR